MVVTEGEKAAAALISVGVVAVGTVTGASGTPSAASLEPLRDRHVVLWPDNDDVGRAHMQRIGAALVGVAASIRWATWLDAPAHGDAADLVRARGDPFDVIDAAGAFVAGPAPGLIVRIDDYRTSVPVAIPWVVAHLAYLGGVSLIAGPPKAGKSTLAAQIQRCRETGERLFGEWDVTTGPTLLVTEEGGIAVVFKTEGMHSLDVLDRRAALRAGLTFAQVLDVVTAWSAEHPGGLVFIDTLAIWAGIVDENDAGQATKAIDAITAVAQAADVAIVLVHHARKGGGDDGEAVRGSGAILATVDIGIELAGQARQR